VIHSTREGIQFPDGTKQTSGMLQGVIGPPGPSYNGTGGVPAPTAQLALTPKPLRFEMVASNQTTCFQFENNTYPLLLDGANIWVTLAN